MTTEIREDVPLTVRQIAERAQLTPRAVKIRLREVLRPRGHRRWLTATLAECRRVFGDDFGRIPTPEDTDARLREVRRDLNASIARQREFVLQTLDRLKRLESRVFAADLERAP